jgi:lipoprotein-anchoring transpeptidase ErfK/SrfK
VKKAQKKQKPPLHSAAIKKLTWQLVHFISVAAVGLGVFFLLIYPWITLQTAARFSAPKPAGFLFKPTLTPLTPSETTLVEPTPAPHSSSLSIPVPVTNKTFASYFSHSWDIPKSTADGSDFWLEVDLSSQTLFAYQGSTLLKSFKVSTGTSDFPTVPGSFKIYARYTYYTMRGPGYDLPDVPYSMFFYKGYSIHGTYWHHNFGTPMSHGCVNMETSAAAWLFDQTSIGTPVFVHI